MEMWSILTTTPTKIISNPAPIQAIDWYMEAIQSSNNFASKGGKDEIIHNVQA